MYGSRSSGLVIGVIKMVETVPSGAMTNVDGKAKTP
jgi:hypothetical protein